MDVRKIGLSLTALSIALVGIIGPTHSASAAADGAAGDGGIKDAGLVRCIDKRLTGSTSPLSGAKATPDQVAALTNLKCERYDVKDLTGLEQFTNLHEYLTLDGNPISNFDAVGKLPKLTQLWMAGTGIDNVRSLSSMKQLTYLDVHDNKISDLGPLSTLKELGAIDINDNRVSDLGPLVGLSHLSSINAKGNKISNPSLLEKFPQLHYINLASNGISDASVFSHFNKKMEVTLSDNHIRDISPLAGVARVSDSFIDVSDQKLDNGSISASNSANVDVKDFSGKPLSQRGSLTVSPSDGVSISKSTGKISYSKSGTYKISIDNGESCKGNPTGKCYSASITQNVGLPALRPSITFDPNGGEGCRGFAMADKDGFVNLTGEGSDFHRENYLLDGWNTDRYDGWGTHYGLFDRIKITQDTTLYARWKPDTREIVTLTYDANGGADAPAPQKMRVGELTTITNKLANPPAGYVWSAMDWNTEKDGSGSSYAFNTFWSDQVSLTRNTTLYAQWKKALNLTYNANGGTGGPSSHQIATGESHEIHDAAPSRNGYAFKGWNTKADGSGKSYGRSKWYWHAEIPAADTNADITLYAQWQKVSNVTISFDKNEGNNSYFTPVSAKPGEKFEIPDIVPFRWDYTFDGWNTKADGTGKSYHLAKWWQFHNDYIAGEDLQQDLILYAQWKKDSNSRHFVKYDAAGGKDAPQDGEAKDSADFTISTKIPHRDGYTFVHWSESPDGMGALYHPGGTIPAWDVTHGRTLWAQWKLNPGVSFDANGGTGHVEPKHVDPQGELVLPANNLQRKGYATHGWNTKKDGSGKSYADGAKITGVTADTTLYAQWTASDHPLFYNSNDGEGAPKQETTTTGQDHKISDITPTREHQRFIGWNTKQDGSGETYLPGDTIPGAQTNETITLFAQWKKHNGILVWYKTNGGHGGARAELAFKHEDREVSSHIPTREGFSFDNWNTKKDGTGEAYRLHTGWFSHNDAIKDVTDDVTLYAQWKKSGV